MKGTNTSPGIYVDKQPHHSTTIPPHPLFDEIKVCIYRGLLQQDHTLPLSKGKLKSKIKSQSYH